MVFNAQRYMHMSDAYFVHSTIWFPYEMKVFDRILYELEYLDRENPHHFTLDLDQLDRIEVDATPSRYQSRTRVYV